MVAIAIGGILATCVLPLSLGTLLVHRGAALWTAHLHVFGLRRKTTGTDPFSQRIVCLDMLNCLLHLPSWKSRSVKKTAVGARLLHERVADAVFLW